MQQNAALVDETRSQQAKMMKFSRSQLWFAVPITIVVLIGVMAVRDAGVSNGPPDRIAPVSAGAAVLTALIILGEALGLYFLLRPPSYKRSWQRALGALIIFGAWAIVNGPAIVIEGVPLFFLHFFWLLIVVIFLLVLTAVSSVAAFSAHSQLNQREVV